MDTLHLILLILLILACGGIVWLVQRSARLARLLNEHENAHIELAARLESEQALRAQGEAHARQLQQSLAEQAAAAREQIEGSLKRIAVDTLTQTQQSLVQTAQQALAQEREKTKGEVADRAHAVEQLVAPLRDVLSRTDKRLGELEQGLASSSATMRQQVLQLSGANEQLRSETARLSRALREPNVRGRYGELQLRRVAELSGMSEFCDFDLQATLTDASGETARPDMIARLPSGRSVVVDAKANIQAYLDALQAGDETQANTLLDRFAKHVAEQTQSLGKKKYWSKVEGSPEFVVMFLPFDALLDAALQRRPDLFEIASRAGVVLATPSTLIALLRVIATGYREHRLAEEAQALRALGVELHERAARAMEFVVKLGGSLNDSVNRYNEFVSSYQSRMEPTLRRFADAGLKAGRDVPEVPAINVVASIPPVAVARPKSLPKAEDPVRNLSGNDGLPFDA